MEKITFYLLTLLFFNSFQSDLFAQEKEPYLSNQTYTYEETIEQYHTMASDHKDFCDLREMGGSDIGEPMHLFVINKSGGFSEADFKDKAVILINNGIHPGEPCGVDASIKLCKELLNDSEKIPENVVIAIIPLYNIGGAKNRNCCSRTNQNGPEMYGFRGNAKNLDLNRDFIKADSKNALAFYQIYHFLEPEIFVDTHTSNGADYQHIMTLITSQIDKMHPKLKKYTTEKLNPALFSKMKENGYDMVPYVHTIEKIPDDGIKDYLESPRYSTGYTNLFNTISYVTETHMLKTYQQRVESTYAFLKNIIGYMDENHEELMQLKQKADYAVGKQQQFFELEWQLDTAEFEMINFKGYEAEYIPSEISGKNRLYYNHEKPFEKKIKYFNSYRATKTIERPEYYIIPKAWKKIIELLQTNEIEVFELKDDTELKVEVYFIANYNTVKNPYEGHYLHHGVEVVKDTMTIQYHKGDYAVPTRNANARFIVETLEPHATDSYLAWNYFDAVLQQKEWFSAYVFEDEAAEILKNNPELKEKLEQKKRNSKEFADNAFAQLYFIFKNSEHYEPTHNRYPVTRYVNQLMKDRIQKVD